MSLEFVKPTDRPTTIDALLYGAEGVGKTTGALTAPGPILLLNSEGANAARFARELYGDEHVREVAVTGRKVLEDAILYLRDGGDGVRSLVLDSLDATHRVLLDERAQGGKPTLPQYGDVGTDLERFCRTARDLPVNVVLVAHELSAKDDESGQIERTPFTGTSNPALGVKLMAMVDVVGYCARVEPPDGQGGDARYMAQLITANGRRGKDRTGRLGKTRELNVGEWLATSARPLPKAASNGAAPTQTVKSGLKQPTAA